MTTSSVDDLTRGADFLFSRNRQNVAVNRARCLACLACTDALLDTRAPHVEDMRLMATPNAFVELAIQVDQPRALTVEYEMTDHPFNLDRFVVAQNREGIYETAPPLILSS